MHNSIILSSTLFGSVYLFGVSLVLINRSHLENKKTPKILIIINGLTFMMSSSVLAYSFYLCKNVL